MWLPVFDRLLVVFCGAVFIALGAFAINDPAGVRARLAFVLNVAKLPATDDQVRMVGVALIFASAVAVVGALLPLGAAPPAR